jgi:hypothetical protein
MTENFDVTAEADRLEIARLGAELAEATAVIRLLRRDDWLSRFVLRQEDLVDAGLSSALKRIQGQ